MPPTIAAFLIGLFTLWLFRRDVKARKNISSALWIPFIWACVIATKPVSLWLGQGEIEADGYQDSVIDKLLYVFLIGAGWFILLRRGLNWSGIFSANKWLMIYFLYLGISLLWAEDSFVAFKRWFKDVGNIVMVLVVLSEKDPLESIKAFLTRCAYLLIPLSALVVRYYPEAGRRYNRWDGHVIFVGICTDKNMFGMTLFVCALSLFWLLLQLRLAKADSKDRTALYIHLGLIALAIWLLTKARSSTAMTCAVVCCGIILAMQAPAIRNAMKRLGTYLAIVALLATVLQAFGLWEVLLAEFAHLVGRDPTFHGRTNIWEALLKQDINPLLGEGYSSFWSLSRMQKISVGYHYLLNEAHNGYLESYLNTGLIGLFLLLTVMCSAGISIKRQVIAGSGYGALRFAFLVACLFCAVSEAIFNRLSLLWLVLLLVIFEFPTRARLAPRTGEQTLPEPSIGPIPEREQEPTG